MKNKDGSDRLREYFFQDTGMEYYQVRFSRDGIIFSFQSLEKAKEFIKTVKKKEKEGVAEVNKYISSCWEQEANLNKNTAGRSGL